MTHGFEIGHDDIAIKRRGNTVVVHDNAIVACGNAMACDLEVQ